MDEHGNVSEGPNMNIACLLDDGTLVVPPFENALNGITVQRMMVLVPQARGAVALEDPPRAHGVRRGRHASRSNVPAAQ